jgi:UDP-2,3-diacylglucosamine pyrophosphatase LpxH
LFDSIDFGRLCKSQWKVLSEFRKLSDTIELIWLIGNHDIGAEMVANLIGAKIMDELVVEGILILHGHTFDTFITAHPRLTWAADWVYGLLQKISMKLARLVKYQSKTFLRNSELVCQRAVAYAKTKGCDRVICGHTHRPFEGAYYCNSGCWTEDTCHFLSIEDTQIHLREYQ